MSKRQPDTALIEAKWSGPLPHPLALEHFERIHPGAAKQIIDHMLAEGEHRRRIEQQAINLDRATVAGNQAIQVRGQWFGLILSVIVFGGGIALAWAGKDVSGLGALITGMVGLVVSMTVGRSSSGKKDGG